MGPREVVIEGEKDRLVDMKIKNAREEIFCGR